MPSNYTIAKVLQRIAYYRGICTGDAGQFPGAAMEVQRLSGVKLEELYKTDWASVRQRVNEADDQVILAIEQIIRDEPVTALTEDKIPLSILELTEIKGLGAKTARKVYDELGVVDLNGLKLVMEDGRLLKVKGFGPALIEKIKAHIETIERKKK